MTDEEGADQGVTYLAIVGRSSAYVLDMYPEERDRYLREMGNAVVSEFATAEEAEAVAARIFFASGRRKLLEKFRRRDML